MRLSRSGESGGPYRTGTEAPLFSPTTTRVSSFPLGSVFLRESSGTGLRGPSVPGVSWDPGAPSGVWAGPFFGHLRASAPPSPKSDSAGRLLRLSVSNRPRVACPSVASCHGSTLGPTRPVLTTTPSPHPSGAAPDGAARRGWVPRAKGKMGVKGKIGGGRSRVTSSAPSRHESCEPDTKIICMYLFSYICLNNVSQVVCVPATFVPAPGLSPTRFTRVPGPRRGERDGRAENVPPATPPPTSGSVSRWRIGPSSRLPDPDVDSSSDPTRLYLEGVEGGPGVTGDSEAPELYPEAPRPGRSEMVRAAPAHAEVTHGLGPDPRGRGVWVAGGVVPRLSSIPREPARIEPLPLNQTCPSPLGSVQVRGV